MRVELRAASRTDTPGWEVAERSRLNEQGCRVLWPFLRTGKHAASGAMRGELIEKVVHRATSNDVDVFDRRSDQRRQLIERCCMTGGETLEDEPRCFAMIRWKCNTALTTQAAAEPSIMSPRSRECRRIEVDDAAAAS